MDAKNPQLNKQLKILFLASGLFLISTPSYAFCFKEAGAIYSVPAQLLQAIAQVESAFDPGAINFRSDTDYDYGLMQIHTSWAKKLGNDLWQSLGNPCQNVKVGAWILAQCLQRHGYTWKGIGCYNATSEEKQMIYAKRVIPIFYQLYLQTSERN